MVGEEEVWAELPEEEAEFQVLALPPPIPKEEISKKGTLATIKSARLARNIYTSLGQVNRAIGLIVEIDGLDGEYSHLFSLDRKQITGSAGRLLYAGMKKLGIRKISNMKELQDVIKALKGLRVKIMNRGGKLYWYPVE